MPPKKSTPVKNKPVINGDALDDAFAVLLRYAEFSGEKLNATHAATAADIAPRTAYTRIAKAKSEAKLNATASCSSGYGVDAFKILLKYAEASGGKLQVPAAAQAAGIAARTAYTKVKNAREEIEAAAVADDDDEGGHAEEETIVEVRKAEKVSEKSKMTKAGDTTRSNGKRKRSNSEESNDTLDAEPIIKKEKVDEGVAMADKDENLKVMTKATSFEELKRNPQAVDNDKAAPSNAIEHEDPAAVGIIKIEEEDTATTLSPQIKAEHTELSPTTTPIVNVLTTTVAIVQEEATDNDKTMPSITGPSVTAAEDGHWGAMMELETDDDQTISPDCGEV